MAERIEYDEQGNRLPADFREPRYAPADMTGINMDAVNANMRNLGVEKASKAIEAAIQFQGLRGYQQALKNGESPEKAMVKYGPMIFNKQASAFAPSMRAISPPVENPLARERFEYQKRQPIHVGQGLYRLNAEGKPETIMPPPEKAIPFAISKDMLGKDKMARMTPKAFAEQLPTLPPYAQTNASNLAQLRAAGLTPKPMPSPSPAPQVLPLPKSKDELKKGARYSTARGEATWNGEKFVQ